MAEVVIGQRSFSQKDLGRLAELPAEELVAEVLRLFGKRAAIGTSLQLSGSVLIDMAHKSGNPFRVFTIDTLRFHQETYSLIDTLEERYGISIERYYPDPLRLEKMIRQHGEYLFFDSKEKQEYCCHIRKVEPHNKVLETLDAWITGLRQDQSQHREKIPPVQTISFRGRTLLKASPLAKWNEERLREYIRRFEVPYNPLFDRGYHSIGCIICSTPIREGEHPRAGRWRWFNAVDDKKECGIHISLPRNETL